MNASRRRLLFGVNLGVNVILAIAATVLAVWAAGRYGGRVDLSGASVNSVSQRTRNLLEKLDKPVRITGIYSTALKEVSRFDQKRRDTVADFLDLYDNAGRENVTVRMIEPTRDQAEIESLVTRVSKLPRFSDELKAYESPLRKYDEVRAALEALITKELDLLDRAGAETNVAQDIGFTYAQRSLSEMRTTATETADLVENALSGDKRPIPGSAIAAVRKFLTRAATGLDWMQMWMSGGANDFPLPPLPPELVADFHSAPGRFAPTLDKVRKYIEEIKPLGLTQIETFYSQLADKTIVVETDNAAEVMPFDVVWPLREGGPGPDGDNRDFMGESVTSSAILRMTAKDRTAVIFVRHGGPSVLHSLQANLPGQAIPPAPFAEIAKELESENFLLEEWDISIEPDPPTVEHAARTIYVALTPTPLPQPNPQLPPEMIRPEQVDRLFAAVEASGMGVFLMASIPPEYPNAGQHPFGAKIRDMYGVNIRENYVALEFQPHPQVPGKWWFKWPTNLRSLLSNIGYEPHPIVNPLTSMATGMINAAPLELTEKAPEGVKTRTVMLEVPATDDVWAIDLREPLDAQAESGLAPRDGDLRPPFPLGVAIETDHSKVVIYANDQFVADGLAFASRPVQVGGLVFQAAAFPANKEILINTLHWLTGNADRIAVGPRGLDAPRLDRLKPGATLDFLRLFIVAIWPALALVVGAGVWMSRRR
ncbi:MAG: hypothetical protein KDA32_11605 [Phycisphaerales bacterium]|nr:hypothetical protein [Phycisphaerales bacterium]